MLERGVPAERSGLAQRKAEFERLGLQRVRASRRRIRRREDMNDFLAMRNQRLERLFRKRRLADQYDSQRGQPRRSRGYQTKLTVARSASWSRVHPIHKKSCIVQAKEEVRASCRTTANTKHSRSRRP